jgi:hypothetical protein
MLIVTNEILQKQEIKLLEQKTNILVNLYKTEKEKVSLYKSWIKSIRINAVIYTVVAIGIFILGFNARK